MFILNQMEYELSCFSNGELEGKPEKAFIRRSYSVRSFIWTTERSREKEL